MKDRVVAWNECEAEQCECADRKQQRVVGIGLTTSSELSRSNRTTTWRQYLQNGFERWETSKYCVNESSI